MAEKRNFIPEIRIEGARIMYRNFSGKEGQYNAAGDRNINVILPEDKDIDALIRDGWNIKWLEPREEGDERRARLEVKIKMDSKVTPNIVLITSRGKTTLGQKDPKDGDKENRNQDAINILDWAVIENVDIVIRPFQWEVNGKTGIKAYLKAIYVTIKEDEFEMKYADLADSAQTATVREDEDEPEENWNE